MWIWTLIFELIRGKIEHDLRNAIISVLSIQWHTIWVIEVLLLLLASLSYLGPISIEKYCTQTLILESFSEACVFSWWQSVSKPMMICSVNFYTPLTIWINHNVVSEYFSSLPSIFHWLKWRPHPTKPLYIS
jgi:hypothetical protein